VDVVVVVPARHRVDDAVAGIHQRAVGRIDHGPGAARDHDRRHRVFETEVAGVEAADRLPQLAEAVRRRVVRLAALERGHDAVLERGRDRELPRAEVAHGEVADGLARRHQGADLARDAEDLRPLHAGDQRRDAVAAASRRRGHERAQVVCGLHGVGHDRPV
jgi:hypothetical protein